MNVRCQSCDTVYRIDPLRVPEGGVRARCTVCSNVIAVSRVAESTAPAAARTRPQHMPKTADRVANSLGDAFIPAPDDTDVITTSPPPPPGADPRVSVPVFADPELNVVATRPVEQTPSWERPREAEAPAAPSAAPKAPLPSQGDLASQRTEQIPAIPTPDSQPAAVEPPKLEAIVAPPPAPRPEPAAPPPSPPPASESSVAPSPTPAPAKAAKPAPRVSRPFSLPRDIPLPTPTTPSTPTKPRPTAPVFRATPGHPVQAAQPAAPAPSRADAGKPINPFLSRDPRQKARRLARALISDMIVYQPEKRQKALREGNLAESFREEIKKSWEEYVEQVGDEIASSTTHFNDALNDILAGGQKVF